MKTAHKNLTGHLAALATVLIWGTTFIATKVLLVDFSPIEILFFRFVIGLLVLFAAHPRILRTGSWKKEGLLALAGLCGVTLYYLLENIALTYTLAANVGVLVSIAPIFTGILAHFFLPGERIRAQFIGGFALAIIGALLISYTGATQLALNPLGDILAILAALVWGIYSILMRRITSWGYNNTACTCRIFFYGLLFMVPALPFMQFNLNLSRFLHLPNLFNMLFLGLGASALCFAMWNWCIGVLGALKTSAYIYLIPVVTLVFALIFLGEQLSANAWLGAALTMAGLFLSEYKSKKALAHSPLEKAQ